MNSPYGTEIIRRYFEALDHLIDRGLYSSDYDYCKTYGIDRSNFAKVRKKPEIYRPAPDWFAPLFIRHRLNAKWLYTGAGSPFPK